MYTFQPDEALFALVGPARLGFEIDIA